MSGDAVDPPVTVEGAPTDATGTAVEVHLEVSFDPPLETERERLQKEQPPPDDASFGTERVGELEPSGEIARAHLKGLIEALIFASDRPIRAADLAAHGSAPIGEVRSLLAELRRDYSGRGVQLDEVAGGWLFRTSAAYAPFVRDLTQQKPVKLTRAQLETLSIVAYRQPITRPEVDDVRGVDTGPVLKLLLERNLVRIIGKKDEPGRPLLYGTTATFLELFGLKSLRDLPTLREFTELSDESKAVVTKEIGDEDTMATDEAPATKPTAEEFEQDPTFDPEGDGSANGSGGPVTEA